MTQLVKPHGADELRPLLLEGDELKAELKKAESLPKVPMTSRETSDLIMLGIGAYTPLEGCTLHRVRLKETDTIYTDYYGPAGCCK